MNGIYHQEASVIFNREKAKRRAASSDSNEKEPKRRRRGCVFLGCPITLLGIIVAIALIGNAFHQVDRIGKADAEIKATHVAAVPALAQNLVLTDMATWLIPVKGKVTQVYGVQAGMDAKAIADAFASYDKARVKVNADSVVMTLPGTAQQDGYIVTATLIN